MCAYNKTAAAVTTYYLIPATVRVPATGFLLRVPDRYCLLPTAYYLLMYLLFTTYYCTYHIPTTYYLLPKVLPTTYYLLPTTYTTYYLLPTTYYLLPTTYYLLPTTYYLLPTTYYTYYLLPTITVLYYLQYSPVLYCLAWKGPPEGVDIAVFNPIKQSGLNFPLTEYCTEGNR